MKIVCDKKEFAMLVRGCVHGQRDGQCCGCVFSGICAQDGERFDGDVMCNIDDLCEIVTEG